MTNQIRLVFLDLGVDSSTVDRKLFLDRLLKVKNYDRHEFRRRSHADKLARRSRRLVSGAAPLGYEIRSIIPTSGRRPMKYYFPWDEERQYGERIVAMHDIQGLSFERIAVKLWRFDVVKPRSGLVAADRDDVIKYYHRCKEGWPLPGGVQWKPPAFKYLVSGGDAIDLTVDE